MTNANSYAQEVDFKDTVSVNLQADDLSKALQELSDSTGLRFAYRHNLVKGKKTQTIHGKFPLDQILEKLITRNRLCYTYQHRQIIIHNSCFPLFYEISGLIIQDSTYKPIPYVAVSLIGKPVGTVADHEGYFELQVPWSVDGKDTLVISSMGYKRDTILISAANTEVLTIKLKEKVYPMQPVVVSPKKYEAIELGNTKDRSSGSLYMDTHGQQTALKIENEKQQEGILSSVKYYLAGEGNTDAPFRVRVYNIDTNGLPGKDLVEDAVVVRPESGEGWLTVNLEELNIAVPPEGIYVAIEGVFPDEYDHYYGDSEFIDLRKQNDENDGPSLTYGQRIGYNRKCRKNTWHFSISKVWFQLEKKSFGVMIAAIVKYEKDNDKEKEIYHD